MVRRIQAAHSVVRAFEALTNQAPALPGYRIMIFPVLLGSGRRLFPETQRKTVLRLAERQTLSSGVVVYSYNGLSG